MKQAAIAAVGLALVVGVSSGCGGGVARHYENTELGIAFDYPSHWELEEMLVTGDVEAGVVVTDRVTVGTYPSDTGTLHGVMVDVYHPLPESMTDDEFYEAGKQRITHLSERLSGAVEERDWTRFGGQRARRYLVTASVWRVPVSAEWFFIRRGDMGFELRCQGEQDRFQEIRTGCQVVYDSFEFTSEQ